MAGQEGAAVAGTGAVRVDGAFAGASAESATPSSPTSTAPIPLPPFPATTAATPPSSGAGPAAGLANPLSSTRSVNTSGPQRTPSLRAQAAFSRLRIGSFGGSAGPRPNPPLPPSSTATSPTPSSPAFGSERALSPDSYSASPARTLEDSVASLSSSTASASGPPSTTSTSRSPPDDASPRASPSVSPAGTSSRKGSLAASFLSSFSPPSRRASVRGPGAGQNGQWPTFASVLPPAGDEAGFVIKTKRREVKLPYSSSRAKEEDDDGQGSDGQEEDEWVLGTELGRGGMGLVREARLLRRRDKERGAIGKEETMDGRGERGEEDSEEEVKVAVKIIPRRSRKQRRHLHPHPQHVQHLPSQNVEHQEQCQLHPAPPSRPSQPSPVPSHSGPLSRGRAELDQLQDPSVFPPLPRSRSASRHRPSLASGGPKPSLLSAHLNDLGANGGRARSTSSPVRPSLAARSRTNLALMTPPSSGMNSAVASQKNTPLPSPGLPDGQGPLGTTAQAGFQTESKTKDVSLQKKEQEGEEEEEADLLDLLLQRELDLWRQLSVLSLSSPSSASTTPSKHGRHIVPLLGLHRSPSADFDYVFMPLASGGTLLSYLQNPPPPPPVPSSASSTANFSSSSSRSRSRMRLTAAGKSSHHVPLAPKPKPKPKPRSSLPFSSPPRPQGLPLSQAGPIFVQIVEALRWLHEEAGVSHRDVKLENLVACYESCSASTSEGEDEDESEEGEEEVEETEEEVRVERRENVGRGRSRTRRGWDSPSASLPSSRAASPEPLAKPEKGQEEPEKKNLRRKRAKGKGKDRLRRRRRKKLVWKLADFGLAELIPSSSIHPSSSLAAAAGAGSPATPRPAGAGAVQGVQPLAALARAGSLSRPLGRDGNALASSVGPSGPAKVGREGEGQKKSNSAFLPSPHNNPISNAVQRRPLVASPIVAGINCDDPSFGSSSAAASSPLSVLLHPVGSLPYSSPEALKSPVPILHPSIDIWALGCVLYALVEGKLPIWEEWELKMRVRLVKGEWEVPEALKPLTEAERDGAPGKREEVEEREREKALVLEVLKGCLEVDVEKRWDIGQVARSEWVELVRRREKEAEDARVRERREARVQRGRQRAMSKTAVVEEDQRDDEPPSPLESFPSSRGRSRGRQMGRSPGGGCPPAPSAGTAAADDDTSMRKSKSRSRSRSTHPPQNHHRLTSRSRSRSSYLCPSPGGTPKSLTPSASLHGSTHHHSHPHSHHTSLSASASSSAFPSPVAEHPLSALELEISEKDMEEYRERSREEREERRLRWDREERDARRRSVSRASGRSG
ncbi:hypothetical protein JCM11251_006961 [Rhodosporidiobolus azoricus]